MTARSHFRGHAIEHRGDRWVYVDTGESVEGTRQTRSCGHCGLADTPEGHDGCLGTLPGVFNACCGHGRNEGAYVQFDGGRMVRGAEAVAEMERLKSERGGQPK